MSVLRFAPQHVAPLAPADAPPVRPLLAAVEASDATGRLAIRVHLEDVTLDRGPVVAYYELAPREAREVHDRAAIAVRLGDPAVEPDARARAGRAFTRRHRQHGLHPAVVRAMVDTVAREYLRALQGYPETRA